MTEELIAPQGTWTVDQERSLRLLMFDLKKILQATPFTFSDLTGLIPAPALHPATFGWTTTMVFSATDADTVAWATGNITTSDGTVYSITGADTGNMVARTFIYLDIDLSTTVLQTSTSAASAVGLNKIMIAVAENETDEAFFHVFGGLGGTLLSANQIAANAITANEIAAGTITAAQIQANTITAAQIFAGTITATEIFAGTITTLEIATDTILAGNIAAGAIDTAELAAGAVEADKINVVDLAAINADLGAITAGTIVIPTGGFIRSGQTAYDVGVGFFIGNVAGTPQMSIGNAAGNKVTWDGTTLTVVGALSGTFPADELTGTVPSISGGIEIVGSLPTLPVAAYPPGAVVFLTTDDKLYRNDDDVWTTAVATVDLTGTIDLASQISGLLPAGNAESGLVNVNIALTAAGLLTGAGGGQADLASLPGILAEASAAVTLKNAQITLSAAGLLSGAGGGQASLDNLPGTIAAGSIETNAITSDKILAGAIIAGKIGALAVDTAELAAGAVTAGKIQAGTITANEIFAGTISATELATNSVTAIKIQAGAVTAGKIFALSIVAGDIAANAIETGKINALAITTAKLGALQVTAAKIAANTITAAQIFAGTITATELGVNAVTADKILAGAVTAAKIGANQVTAVKIAAGVITANKLVATLTWTNIINLSSGGHMKQGQTAFDVGTGFFIGDSSGAKLSLGNASGDKMTWNGSVLTVTGIVNLDQGGTFTPGWTGFLVNPTGTLSELDLGNFAIVWATANHSGVSNSIFFTVTGVPSAIRPGTQVRQPVEFSDFSGFVHPGIAIMGTTGIITCALAIANGAVTHTNHVHYSTGAFTASGFKGINTGFQLFYSLL